jgi:hypothetical protein
VCACLIYQRNKTEQLHPVGLLRPLQVPSVVWADITINFIEGLPKVSGKSYILTVVDASPIMRISFRWATPTPSPRSRGSSSTTSSSFTGF